MMRVVAVLLFAALATPASALSSRSLLRAGSMARLPDPNCHTGVISMSGAGPDPQVCCAGYCGECSDYPTCEKVRGQDSANACCATKVAEMSCDAGAPANVCLKKCSEALPPCILDAGEKFEMPDVTSAAKDCNEAVPEWMQSAEAAVKGAVEGDEGEKQWKDYQKRSTSALLQKPGVVDALLKAGLTKKQAATYLHYKRTGAMPGCTPK